MQMNTHLLRLLTGALSLALALSCAACKSSEAPSALPDGTTTGGTSLTDETSLQDTTESGDEEMTTGESSTTGNRGSSGNTSASKSTTATTSAKAAATTTSTKTITDPATLEQIAYYQDIIDTECAWIAKLQLPGGAIPMTYADSGSLTVNPYFSDFAALGLMEGDNKYLTNVKSYMDWHFSHLNTKDYNGVDGTIYDYTITVSDRKVTGEQITYKDGKPLYDSTDSYAATFLSVLYRYYERSGDKAYMQSHYAEIKRVINALFATMHNGLTMAKPDYEFKYLMDNAEVYKGLDDAAKLFSTALSGHADASAQLTRLQNARDTLKSTIESNMWNSKGYYEAALDKPGKVAWNFSWDEFYPSATANISLISNGVFSPGSDRAKLIYKSFNQHFVTGRNGYNWPSMSNGDTFYWCTVVHTAAVMDDRANVKTFMDLYKKVMRNHAYPLYNAEAGHAVRAASQMIANLSK